jgi:hypothetical protein
MSGRTCKGRLSMLVSWRRPVVELPTSELAPKPEIRIWGRCSVRQDGKLVHADRPGHPSVSSFFNTDDTSWNTAPASR